MKTLRIALAVSIVLSVTRGVRAQTGCPDWSSSFGLPGLSTIRGMGTFDDGTGLALYVGGPTTVDGYPQLVGHGVLRWNGTTWSVPGTNLVAAEATAFATFDDGSGPALYVAGSFTLQGVSGAVPVVRWDGTTWSAVGGAPFSSGFGYGGKDLAVFDDGHGPKLYVASFDSAVGIVDPDNNVWRLDGASWTRLSSGADGGVYALAVFDSGTGPRLVAGGLFQQIDGLSANDIASWDGSSWSTLGIGFGPQNHVVVYDLTVYDDGNTPVLIAGGQFDTAGGIAARNVAQWDGTNWSFVGNGATTTIAHLLVADVGSGPQIFAGGYALPPTEPDRLIVLEGKNWVPVGGDLNGDVGALALFDAGSGPELFVGGGFTQAGGAGARSFASWDGTSFHAHDMVSDGADQAVHALRTLDLGAGPSLYAGGEFTVFGDAGANAIARWDGASWHSFGSGIDGSVQAIAAFDDGSGPALYAGGDFLPYGSPLPNVARFDGAQWQPLSTGTDGGVRALESFDDGSGRALYAGGTFTHAGGANITGIARWNGSSWSQVGAGVTDWVYALAAFDDGTGNALYAGGRYIGVLKWDGSAWTSIGGLGSSPVVYALHVWDDGSGPALYAGGKFSATGGSNVAKLVGGSWIALGSGTDKLVSSITDLEDANGRGLFVTGYFGIAGGQAAANVARWNGSSFSSLGAAFSGTNLAWDAIAAFDDGASGGPGLFVGGTFDHGGTSASSNIAKWESCSVATPFCFGDGSGAACPCVNSGIAGHGCENSSATGGALLRATGSVAKDDVVLVVSGERPTVLSIFLQGNAVVGPLIFGDGLRCAGGSLKRLYAKNAVGGAVSAPGPNDPSIRARSAALGDTIPAGAMRYYQTYYRDPVAGFCPPPRGNLWNVTNGLQIRW